MNPAGLVIPLDFERRESIAILARKVNAVHPPDVPGHSILALAIRIWIDWAGARKEFRALKCRLTNDKPEIDWTREDLTYVIEGSARWNGESGALMRACLDAGFILLDRRGEDYGLLLDGFWPLNEHLSPDYKSIQQRGGHAAAAKRLAKDVDQLAKQRREVFEKQNFLPFGATEVTPEEQEACYALFIRLYRVTGLTEMPGGDTFTEFAMQNALSVIRNYTPDQITEVEVYILTNRDNPEVVKIPDRILEHFGTYAEKAGAL